MAFVGALRSAVRRFLPSFCGNGGAIHMGGETTHGAEGIEAKPCVLKPEDFSGALRTPGSLDSALYGSQPSGGFPGLAGILGL